MTMDEEQNLLEEQQLAQQLQQHEEQFQRQQQQHLQQRLLQQQQQQQSQQQEQQQRLMQQRILQQQQLQQQKQQQLMQQKQLEFKQQQQERQIELLRKEQEDQIQIQELELQAQEYVDDNLTEPPQAITQKMREQWNVGDMVHENLENSQAQVQIPHQRQPQTPVLEQVREVPEHSLPRTHVLGQAEVRPTQQPQASKLDVGPLHLKAPKGQRKKPHPAGQKEKRRIVYTPLGNRELLVEEYVENKEVMPNGDVLITRKMKRHSEAEMESSNIDSGVRQRTPSPPSNTSALVSGHYTQNQSNHNTPAVSPASHQNTPLPGSDSVPSSSPTNIQQMHIHPIITTSENLQSNPSLPPAGTVTIPYTLAPPPNYQPGLKEVLTYNTAPLLAANFRPSTAPLPTKSQPKPAPSPFQPIHVPVTTSSANVSALPNEEAKVITVPMNQSEMPFGNLSIKIPSSLMITAPKGQDEYVEGVGNFAGANLGAVPFMPSPQTLNTRPKQVHMVQNPNQIRGPAPQRYALRPGVQHQSLFSPPPRPQGRKKLPPSNIRPVKLGGKVLQTVKVSGQDALQQQLQRILSSAAGPMRFQLPPGVHLPIPAAENRVTVLPSSSQKPLQRPLSLPPASFIKTAHVTMDSPVKKEFPDGQVDGTVDSEEEMECKNDQCAGTFTICAEPMMNDYSRTVYHKKEKTSSLLTVCAEPNVLNKHLGTVARNRGCSRMGQSFVNNSVDMDTDEIYNCSIDSLPLGQTDGTTDQRDPKTSESSEANSESPSETPQNDADPTNPKLTTQLLSTNTNTVIIGEPSASQRPVTRSATAPRQMNFNNVSAQDVVDDMEMLMAAVESPSSRHPRSSVYG